MHTVPFSADHISDHCLFYLVFQDGGGRAHLSDMDPLVVDVGLLLSWLLSSSLSFSSLSKCPLVGDEKVVSKPCEMRGPVIQDGRLRRKKGAIFHGDGFRRWLSVCVSLRIERGGGRSSIVYIACCDRRLGVDTCPRKGR